MLDSLFALSAKARRQPLGDAIAHAGRWATRQSPAILHRRLVRLWAQRAPELLAAESPPGCLFCIETPGGGECRAFGLADAAAGTPLKIDTPFRGASLAKPLVALTALTLVRDGLLSLDAPVPLEIDGRSISRDGDFPDPTLRQLLSHTSGLNVHSLPQTPAGESAPDFAALLEGRPDDGYRLSQVHAPGSEVLYSGAAFYLVGRLIERVAGDSVAEVVRARVCGPLCMHATTMNPPAQAGQGVCREHAPDRTPLPRQIAYAVASGSLVSTGRDFLRFASAMLPRRGRPPFAELLGDQTARELLRPCGPALANPIYSVGFRIRLRSGGADLSHGGIREGLRAVIETIAGGSAAVFALANGEEGFRVVGPLIGEAKALTVRANIHGQLRPVS